MTSPRFVPKLYAVQPKDFGLSVSVAWKPATSMTDDELDQLRAAQAHHAVALQIRRRILTSGRTIEQAADEFGANRTRLGRILRGDVVLRLEDMAWADRCFGLSVLAWDEEGRQARRLGQ